MTKNTEKTTFFTIVTVTKNNLDGLKRTEKSMRFQSCIDYEWIIIDGESLDGTHNHLKTINATSISEPDNGIYDAMNKGLSRAQGTYILFLNAGDMLADETVLENIKNAAKNEPDFIYGDALEDGDYKPARNPKIKSGMFTHHQAMLYKQATLADMRYNTAYKIAADYELTARFLNRSKDSVYCNFPICNFESGGISQTNAKLGRQEQFQIRKTLKLAPQIQNRIITIAQSLFWRFRQYCPSLYWHLKSSGNTAPANAQSDTPQHHQEDRA